MGNLQDSGFALRRRIHAAGCFGGDLGAGDADLYGSCACCLRNVDCRSICAGLRAVWWPSLLPLRGSVGEDVGEGSATAGVAEPAEWIADACCSSAGWESVAFLPCHGAAWRRRAPLALLPFGLPFGGEE